MANPFQFPQMPDFPSLYQTRDPKYIDGFIDYNRLFEILSNVTDVIPYNPEEFILGDEWSNFGNLIVEYHNIYPKVKIGQINQDLNVTGKFCATKGTIDLSTNYPIEINFNSVENKISYLIKIPYLTKDDPDVDEEYAIILAFDSYYHWVKAIKMIGKHINYNNEKYIFNIFKHQLDEVAGSNHNILDAIYEKAPIWVIAKFGKEQVFKDLRNILENGLIDEIGTNEELAILKMIRSFVTAPFFYETDHFYASVKEHRKKKMDAFQRDFLPKNVDYFLTECINSKMQNHDSVFHRMYDKLNDYGGTDNFSKFIQLMYVIWLNSRFPFEKYNNVDVGSDFVLIDYHADKILGFYDTDHDFYFAGDKISIYRDVPVGVHYTNQGDPVTDYENLRIGFIGIYQPVRIPKKESNGSLKSPDNIIPGFFIKAIDDKNYWSNVESASWLALDVITTISGIGNLLKLRYLASVPLVLISGIEVASGTLSIMLRLLEDKIDPKFRNDLQTFLVYLDIFSLGIGSLNTRFLRNSAKDALDSMPYSLKKKYPEVRDKLHDFARNLDKGKKNNAIGDLSKSFVKNLNLPFKKEVTIKKVIGQQESYTCVPASLKMVLTDHKLTYSEQYLATALETTQSGTVLLDIPSALKKLYLDDFVTITRGGGRDVKITLGTLEKLLAKGNRNAIVSVKSPDFGAHAIVVDKIVNGRVFIRDPLPLNTGASYSMSIKDFSVVYNKKFVIINKKKHVRNRKHNQ